MSDHARRLRAHFYACAPSDWQVYHQVIAEHLRHSMTVLDVGTGKGTIAPFPWVDYPDIHLIGLDPDPSAAQNPNLHSFRLLENDADWPIEDGIVDMVLARYVLEHVATPAAFFANVRRVLAPGGLFIFLTPNKYHPTMIASRYLPQAIKTRILTRTSGTASSDIFVTWYRLNSARELRKQAHHHGLVVERLATREFQPVGYLDFSLWGFLLACGYHQLIKLMGLEPLLGQSIVGVLRRERR